jgi:hypothetical protein
LNYLFKLVTRTHDQRRKLLRTFSKARLLVVDEMSMLSPDMLVAMDKRLRSVLDRNKPFGGVGVLLCGDHLQIPPTTGGLLAEAMHAASPRPRQAQARALYGQFETYHLII